MTNDSPNKVRTANAPVGFLAGFAGGMVAHYLTHSPEGKKLRDQLLKIYDAAKADGHQWLDTVPDSLPATTTTVIDALDSPMVLKQSRYATSLLKRVKAKLAKSEPNVLSPTPAHEVNKPAKRSRNYFTQKGRK